MGRRRSNGPPPAAGIQTGKHSRSQGSLVPAVALRHRRYMPMQSQLIDQLIDRYAPNAGDIPFYDRGYFAIRLGIMARRLTFRLVRRSERFNLFMQGAAWTG